MQLFTSNTQKTDIQQHFVCLALSAIETNPKGSQLPVHNSNTTTKSVVHADYA